LRYAIHGSSRDLAALLTTTVVAFAIGLALPIATGKVLGEFVARSQTGLIVQACVAVMVAGVCMGVLGLLSRTRMVRLETRADSALQAAVWDRLLRLPTRFFRRSSTGEIANAAAGIGLIRHLASSSALGLVSAVIMGVVNIVLMAIYSLPLTGLALVLLLGHVAIFATVALRQLRWQRQLIDVRYRLSNMVYQRLRGLPKLRVAAAEGFAYEKWAEQFARSQNLSGHAQRIQGIATTLSGAYTTFSTVVVFALLAGPARGSLSTATFLSWFTAFGIALGAAGRVTGTLSAIGVIVPVYRKLHPILSEPPEATRTLADPGRLNGAIRLSDVSFRYNDHDPLVLDQVDLDVAPGEFVAIVGPTGCGKSTLLRLLLGFETPAGGTIAYDGRDLRSLDVTAVRRQCGVVLQNAAPFAGTLLANIRGTGNATLEEVWQAAALASLAEDISKMPMGMSTMIGDGGGSLSGGQRQRLMIAQAMIGRPRLLFLDEATSALDNTSQATVSQNLHTIAATRVVIAHRLSTVMDADRVIVLDGGRVVQQGPPKQLLAEPNGTFRRLVERQRTSPHRTGQLPGGSAVR
jgi:NHLM bacteriocin system ABC transporter ATP-binding protein